eukprot:s53_g28.t4
MVLHNLSKKQRRMVKYFEIRDMNGAAISTLMSEGTNQLSKIKSTLGLVQDFYPEMIHQVSVLNSTSAFSGLFNFVSPLLNERMQAKIKACSLRLRVLNFYQPVFNLHSQMRLQELAGLMEPKALHSWVQETSKHLSWSHLVVPSGGNAASLQRILRKSELRDSALRASVDFECEPWPSFPQARDLCQQLLAFQPEDAKTAEPEAHTGQVQAGLGAGHRPARYRRRRGASGMQEAALPSDLSSHGAYLPSRIDAKVAERASLDGMVMESFYLQQQIHWEFEKHPISAGGFLPRSMAHVARELLKKELVNLMKDESCGFSVGLEDDSDFFTWRVVFEGPSDSLYEGGIFTAILKFPGDFPNNPPEMRFETEMWHPNIYPDGRVCISILHPPGTDRFNDQETADERWRPILGVHSILISVISMLVDPNLNSPANIDAAVHMKNDFEGWKKKVRQLTRKSVEG